jgi:hypothetical protein
LRELRRNLAQLFSSSEDNDEHVVFELRHKNALVVSELSDTQFEVDGIDGK